MNKNFARLLIGSGESSPEIRYLTGISTPDDFICLEYSGSVTALMSKLEISRARQVAKPGVSVLPESDYGTTRCEIISKAAGTMKVKSFEVPPSFPLGIAEKLRAANEARRKQIDHLAERCRTGSDEEKAAARKELTEIFRESYQKRLADSRRHLQEMETRMKHLAETLKKKEANADADIDLLVENCIRRIRPQRPGQAPGLPVK